MPYREQIPIDKGIDNTYKLMTEGYNYISNQRNKFGRDIFETRVFGGKKAICIAGEEAVKMFYDVEKIMRHGSAPKRLRQTLFGEHAIQVTDEEKHRHRKELFMSLMTKERLEDVKNIVGENFVHAIDGWTSMENIVLYDEMVRLLTRSACKWAGVPLDENEVGKRANELEAIFDSAGAVGPRHWKGRTSRNLVESWLQGLIQEIRNGNLEVPEEGALYQMSWYRDENGELVNDEMAAVELVNILRPIVAISVYITFEALALYEHPAEKEKLRNGGDEYSELFIQEVRRYYPFFPLLAGKVREDFLWNGHDFLKGNLVLLDIYGTNHHPDIWEHPNAFDPERFRNREENFYDFIPQGGGDYYRGHRCAGEWLTIEVMKVAIDFFVNKIDYEVPKQDLRYSMVRFPSLPRSRFVVSGVRRG